MGAVRAMEYENNMRKKMAERVRMVRIAFGLTQTQMADKLNISRQSLYYYEKGIRNVDVCVVAKIREQFGVSTDWLMGLSDTDRKMKSIIDKRESISYNVGE